jgi:hypothetical protein
VYLEVYLINLPVYALLGKESKIRSVQERGMIIRIIPEVYMYIYTHTHTTGGYSRQNKGFEDSMVHPKQQTPHLQSPHACLFHVE